MGGLRFSLAAAILPAALLLMGAGYPQEIVGLDIAAFKGREVLVLRTSGDVPAPGAYNSDRDSSSVSFSLRMVGADNVALPAGGELIRSVALDSSSPEGVRVTLTLDSPELTEQQNLRISQPGVHLILVEVFGPGASKQQTAPITDPEKELGLEVPAESPAKAAGPARAAVPADIDLPAADSAAIDGLLSLDLRNADPGRVLSLAAEHGLLDLSGRVRVLTEGWGEISMSPAGLSLSGWADASGPGELFLSGSAAEIAAFLKAAEPAGIDAQPSFSEYWASHMPRPRGTSGRSGGLAMGGKSTGPAGRNGTTNASASSNKLPGGGNLSDIRVTLPASAGADLLDTLNYLSRISGISLIVDPYAFDEPFGSRRQPLPPREPEAANDEPGFRDAGIFNPQIASGGSVMGNLDNVPFDMALNLILGVHELEYIVYGGGDTRSGNIGRNDDPYTKPVILVTSRERLEQELAGTSVINLHQMHYADPDQVTDLLGNFSLLPGSQSGWYVYRGGGNSGGGNGGGGGNSGGGGGNAGGGGSGGAGGGHGTNSGSGADLIAWRGFGPSPVLAEVERAIDSGDSVLRVLLSGDPSEEPVSIFSR